MLPLGEFLRSPRRRHIIHVLPKGLLRRHRRISGTRLAIEPSQACLRNLAEHGGHRRKRRIRRENDLVKYQSMEIILGSSCTNMSVRQENDDMGVTSSAKPR